MPPGGSHKHVVTYSMNKWIPCDRVLKSPIYAASGVLGGISKTTMAVVRGYPAKLSGGASIVDQAASIAYSYVQRTHWKMAPFESTMVDMQTSLATTGTAIDTLLDTAT